VHQFLKFHDYRKADSTLLEARLWPWHRGILGGKGRGAGRDKERGAAILSHVSPATWRRCLLAGRSRAM